MCQRLLELTGSVCHAPNAPTPASLISEAPQVFVCQSRGTEKTASRTPQGCLGSALIRYCFKNPAQNSQVPHAKSKVTEAGGGRWGSHSITSDCTQGSPCLPLHSQSSQSPTRDVSLLCRGRYPWSEAAFLSWAGILLAFVRALHPLQKYEG